MDEWASGLRQANNPAIHISNNPFCICVHLRLSAVFFLARRAADSYGCPTSYF
jgi:hypothetical protein